MTLALLIATVFCAAFMQTLTGFGFALIVMPVATFLLGLRLASPTVALIAFTSYVINVMRYRQSISLNEVPRLAVAIVFGVPIGVWALVNVSESVVRLLLGAVLIGYAVYSLSRFAGPSLRPHPWAYLAGFIAGCLGGAYNTPGPPLIVYASLRQWAKDEFRAVLQLLFLLTATQTVAAHYLAQNLSEAALAYYLWCAPALLLGGFLAAFVDKKIDKERFRRLVAVMILVLGLSLILDFWRH